MKNNSEKAIWLIDRGCRNLKRWHSYKFAIFVFYIIVATSFYYLSVVDSSSVSWDEITILIVAGIWYLVVNFRPDLVLKWSSWLDPRITNDVRPYLEQSMRDLAWELRGKRILESDR